MNTRKIGTALVLLAFAAVLGKGSYGLAAASPKKNSPVPTFLSQTSLKGSMQGSAGIAIDLNGDGNEDLVIGAPYSQAKGALIVYLASPEGFRERPLAVVKGEGNLGWSLVSLGDPDGDGKSYFAAGAVNGSGENVSLSGTVILFKGGDKPQDKAPLEGEYALDRFGYTLASGDLNGDGYLDLIVGAPFHSPSPDLFQQGAVYVYFGPGYDPSTRIRIPATSAYKGLGFSLASGDINGDGVDDLLLQASGKVIGYYGSLGAFSPAPADPDVVFTSADAGFGRAIAVLWDVDGDGIQDIAVGANQATIDGVSNSGRLFILQGGSGERTVKVDTNPPDLLAKIDGEPNGGRFAYTLLPVGDVDGDGIPDLAVGAIHADGDPWLITGKIFLFSGAALIEGTDVGTVRAIAGEARDMHLGTFLALVAKGRQLAAGAPTEDNNIGRVRLFDLH
jgi:hypothetical protein